MLGPRDTENHLIGKDPDAGKDRGQEEKGMPEDATVGWHHRLNGHESEKTPRDGDAQGSLACCSPWGRKKSDTAERLNSNNHGTGYEYFVFSLNPSTRPWAEGRFSLRGESPHLQEAPVNDCDLGVYYVSQIFKEKKKKKKKTQKQRTTLETSWNKTGYFSQGSQTERSLPRPQVLNPSPHLMNVMMVRSELALP